MKLLKNEELEISSNGDKIVLTNQRIMMKDKVWGKSYNIYIFLEKISSIETQYKSNILFVLLGILSILGALILGVQNEKEGALGALIIGVLLIFFWWFTRKHLITITSDGGKSLDFIVDKMSENKVEEFVTSVQESKLLRINQLAKL